MRIPSREFRAGHASAVPPGDPGATHGVGVLASVTPWTSDCRIGAPPVPAMRERGWGRVVAITSISVRQPIAGLILSNTARAGVTGFLKTLALEVAGDGVTVNSVLPGSHDTDRLRSLYGGDLSGAAAQT